MNQERNWLRIGLYFLGALAVLAALLRVLAYTPARQAASGRPTEPTRFKTSAVQPARPSAPAALEELLPEGSVPLSPQAQQPVAASYPHASQAALRYPRGRASDKQIYPGKRQSHSAYPRYVQTNFYSPDDKSAAVPYTPSVAGGATSGSFASSTWQAQIKEERARMLAPYLRPNRKEKEKMDAQWNKFSAAIDRAVAQALHPKSKKEAMLAKYAPAQAGQAQTAAAGPFAPVMQAVSAQKQEVVQSFGSAFGSAAARQAGGLMDSFASEVSQALNTPDATAQQTSQRIKELAKKYQKEMDNLAQKSQYEKFVAQRVAQDAKQKEELGALYPDEKAQISQLIDQTREKDLALATQNLSREEYFNQLAQNNQALRSGIGQLLAQGGKSSQGFQQWEQGQTQQYLEQLNRLEETGQIQSVARVANADEKQHTQSEVSTQSKRIKEEISAAFGAQAMADFEPILNHYQQVRNRIDEAELSPAEREAQKAKAVKEANRQVIDQAIRHVEKLDIPAEQKQKKLEELRAAYNNFQ